MTTSTGLLHNYTGELSAFEHGDGSSSSSLILVTGLNGQLPTVGYASTLARALQEVGWCMVEVLLSSAGAGWGSGSVTRDAEELAVCVRFLKEKRGKEKVVLMGHSTGCQDVIAYPHFLKRTSFRSITGSILQAPVSDREVGVSTLRDDPELKNTPSPLLPSPPATEQDFIPQKLSTIWGTSAGITFKRWNSLVAKADSDEIDLDKSEDFFSSDMTVQRWRNVFAPVESPLLVLLSEQDEAYPPSVDVNKLLPMFKAAMGDERWNEGSRIIPGATHAIEGAAPRKVLIESVTQFVQKL